MHCIQCKQLITDESKAVLVTCDGDFACSEECKKKWEKERDFFYEHIITDDAKFSAWLGVPGDLTNGKNKDVQKL